MLLRCLRIGFELLLISIVKANDTLTRFDTIGKKIEDIWMEQPGLDVHLYLIGEDGGTVV